MRWSKTDSEVDSDPMEVEEPASFSHESERTDVSLPIRRLGGLRLGKQLKKPNLVEAQRRLFHAQQQARDRSSRIKPTPPKNTQIQPYFLNPPPAQPARGYSAAQLESTPHLSLKHMLLPHIIAGYVQLLFNVAVVTLLLYSVVSFVLSVRADIRTKVDEEMAFMRAESQECRRQFYENRCDQGEAVVPKMKSLCEAWSQCIIRDPKSATLKTRLSAQTLAEIVNSFVEPISYKTLAFVGSFVVGFTILSNIAFQMARSRTAGAAYVPPPPAAVPAPASQGAYIDHHHHYPRSQERYTPNSKSYHNTPAAPRSYPYGEFSSRGGGGGGLYDAIEF